MVEGDLVDLTLPSLLAALSRDGSSAVLQVQRGADQGAIYFSEGALVHARAGKAAGDEAVYRLLEWHEGRFRLMRDAERHPRTITHPLNEFLQPPQRRTAASSPVADERRLDHTPDERLLEELLGLLTGLEQDRARIADVAAAARGVHDGGVSILLMLTAVVNSVIAFAVGRSSDSSIRPSEVLARLAETEPYTQLLGEEQERITVATAAALLKSLQGSRPERQRTFQDLCRALIDVLALYGSTLGTFFHRSREREEWRATFDLFVEDLRGAVQQIAL